MTTTTTATMVANTAQKGTDGELDEEVKAQDQQEGQEQSTESSNESSSAASSPADDPADDAAAEPASNLPSDPPKQAKSTEARDPSVETIKKSTGNPASPARRRPPPPAKGILKPPPPPAKTSFGNRLRDIAAVVQGGARSLFEPLPEGADTPGAGPSTQPGVGGTLNAISGRFGLGLGRLMAPPGQSPSASPVGSPSASPRPRAATLPELSQAERPRPKQPLKRATFILPSMSITYPISSYSEPWSEKVLADRAMVRCCVPNQAPDSLQIESSHRSMMSTLQGAKYWTPDRLITLYENACRGREERARVGIVRAIENLPDAPRPRSIHISLRPVAQRLANPTPPPPYPVEVPLNRHAAEALADVLTAEWGLTELKLENGVIDSSEALRPILHALLVSGTLPVLSLAGNKNIKANGWQYLALFLKRAKSLRFVDLAETTWDKRGIEFLVQALNRAQVKSSAPPEVPDKASSAQGSPDIPPTAPTEVDSAPASPTPETPTKKPSSNNHTYNAFIPSAPLLKISEDETDPAAVQTLRMDGCTFRSGALEALGKSTPKMPPNRSPRYPLI